MLWPSRWRNLGWGAARPRLAGLFALLAALAGGAAAHAEESGTDLFRNYCASCHGVDGRAQTSPGHYYRIPDWTASSAAKKLTDDQIRTQIRTGKLRPDQSGMPAFRSLSDAQVNLLIAFVRKLSASSGN